MIANPINPRSPEKVAPLRLDEVPPLPRLAERLAEGRGLWSLHETIPAARPAILAALFRRLRRTMLVVLPTADAAERALGDALHFLGEDEPRSAVLLRPREEAVGAQESPTERSARITLLAELAAGVPRLILAPLAAIRQYVLPPERFRELTLRLGPGTSPGWEALQQHLHRVGYTRVDVVAAAGEYAVRGGILDLFPATADRPVRVEFSDDEIVSLRAFDLESQRSIAELSEIVIAPWSEAVRDDAARRHLRAAADAFAPEIRAALDAFVESDAEIPEAWAPLTHPDRATLADYLPPDAVVVLDEPGNLAELERAADEERDRDLDLIGRALAESDDRAETDATHALLARVAAPVPRLSEVVARTRDRAVLVLPGGIETAHGIETLEPAVERFVLEARPVEHFARRLSLFAEQVRAWSASGERIVVVTSGVSRMRDLLATYEIPPDAVQIEHGSLESGFWLPRVRLRVLGDREIFGQPPRRVKLRAVKEGVPVTLADLRVGDYVVHAVHGIAQYRGLRTETILGATQDYLDLQFAGSDRMLLPVTQMHQIGKYGAAESQTPRLSKMGGADWQRTKSRVSESLAKIADELVRLYAEREVAPGHAFSPDTPWQREMEEAFPYEPTPDQQKAIEETKRDMERARPMDRLVCGDVGYGKTEVAIRAAFKAVADKKQVAVLVPTTLLADQHYRTFSERLAAFPIRIEALTRYTGAARTREILRDLASGAIDIVVGTHRLLQKDVVFADLGLIVVDEEQRFGVMHKERLKEYRASVDVLTLSATPIPRTLHMALMGVRDLSLIRTAPKNRLSIRTVVAPASDALVRHAIDTELDRGGQVYYLHNRVASIHAVKNALEKLVPRARIAIAHGQMGEREIEPIMHEFVAGRIDVLVATTIIENGLDIPNVNTMIVDDADRFGLAQLYQLRGRVGRSNHQAYCYLLYQGHKALTEDAKARLEAIREFTHLGSGLQIAMRDLEIRGAGNLLGSAQSGFVAAVGFDTYCHLLAEAIAQRRGAGIPDDDRREAVIDVKVDAYIPDGYLPQVSQKIAVYQQLARARSETEVEEIAAGVRDRFGPLPRPLGNLVELTKLRTIALAKRIARVVVEEHRLTLGIGPGFALDPSAIPVLQSATKNRFRFGEGKIVVDLPPPAPGRRPEEIWMPLLRRLLEAL